MLILEIANSFMHTDDSADYSYVVKINNTAISCGKNFGHQRGLGWKALVKTVLEDAHPIEPAQ